MAVTEGSAIKTGSVIRQGCGLALGYAILVIEGLRAYEVC